MGPQCGRCHREGWVGRVEVTPPSGADLDVAHFWHRRTFCRFCGWGHDEIRSAPPYTITSRHQPVRVVRDAPEDNPFAED